LKKQSNNNVKSPNFITIWLALPPLISTYHQILALPWISPISQSKLNLTSKFWCEFSKKGVFLLALIKLGWLNIVPAMDPHNFFLIACTNFWRRLNLETLTRVMGQTLPGSHIWFSRTWEPVVQFSIRISLVTMARGGSDWDARVISGWCPKTVLIPAQHW